MRVLLTLAAVFSLALAGPGLAAQARKPPPAPAKPAPAAALKPAVGGGASQSKPALSGQLAPPLSFAAAPGLAALGFGDRGLESMRLGTADQGPACRQACSNRRYLCGTDDEGCAENWRQCVVQCQ